MRISDPKAWYQAVHPFDSELMFSREEEVIYADEYAAELVRLILAHPVTRRMVDDQLMIESVVGAGGWEGANRWQTNE